MKHSTAEFTYRDARRIVHASTRSAESLLVSLRSSLEGLHPEQVQSLQIKHGRNTVLNDLGTSTGELLEATIHNPFHYLILLLTLVSWFSGEHHLGLALGSVFSLSAVVNLIQRVSYRSKVKSLIASSEAQARVLRKGSEKTDFENTSASSLVPGDIISIRAGDMVPADLRLFSAYHLMINQSAINGETRLSEKGFQGSSAPNLQLNDLPNICLMGTQVMSGKGTGIVLSTGSNTYFGSMALQLKRMRNKSNFDPGATQFVNLLLIYFAIATPVILYFGFRFHHQGVDLIIFAAALSLGLIPELLTLMSTLNLSLAALSMSKKKVLVKNLESIQNLGAIDILCTDKTGTITEDSMSFEGAFGVTGQPSSTVIRHAYLNSFFQSGIKNYVDVIVLQQSELFTSVELSDFHLEKELPFDFLRKRGTVFLSGTVNSHLVVCKGASEEVLPLCDQVLLDRGIEPFSAAHRERFFQQMKRVLDHDFRLILVAAKNETIRSSDEEGLTLLGYLAFSDPKIKATAADAIRTLAKSGILIKILTGDNAIIAEKIAKRVGLPFFTIMSGTEITHISDFELAGRVEKTDIFCKLSPEHKMRVILALRKCGHRVGFLGEGINDSPALRAADVGISVSNAVDIARNSADIILLANDLTVLAEGVRQGRKSYGNLAKYVRMSCSSNVGHIFSVLAAGAFLPFLPITAVQVVIQKLLNNISQMSLPFDDVDEDFLKTPQNWNIPELQKTMIFMGPLGSLRAVFTFCLMWFFFRANNLGVQSLFQTGVFVEGVVAQSFIIHLNRTRKIPFFQSRASIFLTLITLGTALTGMCLPWTRVGKSLGLVELPTIYFAFLILILSFHAALAQRIKIWIVKRFGAF